MKLKYLTILVFVFSVICVKQQTIKAQEETSQIILDLRGYSTEEIINAIEKEQQKRKNQPAQQQTKNQSSQKEIIVIIDKSKAYEPSISTIVTKGLINAMVAGSEGAVQAIQGFDKQILNEQKAREEQSYKEQSLEYQRRQAEALEEQNRRSKEEHYLRYGY